MDKNMKTESSQLETLVRRNEVLFKRFNNELDTARKNLSKACSNYLKSDAHKELIEICRKMGAIN